MEETLTQAVDEIKQLPVDQEMANRKPNGLAEIRALRPQGPRRIWRQFDQSAYLERLEGAPLGRFAGRTLGAPVEGWPVAKMKALAEENGQAFPPADYWSDVPEPARLRYELRPRSDRLSHP